MGQWVYIAMGASLLLSIFAFITGIAPVGIALLVAFAIFVAVQAKSGGGAPARRAERNEERDVTENLGPAHEGQAHMTPDKL